jgi:WD40 repeat protein
LITQQDGKFINQEFDLRAGELIRKPHQLLDQAGSLSVSNNGVLVFRNVVDLKDRLVWRDRGGTQIGIQGGPGNRWAIQLSPDKRSIAEVRHDASNGQFQLWAGPLAGGSLELISRLDHIIQVAWSSDGKALLYFDYRRNVLVRRNVSPLAPEAVVAASTTFRPNSVFQGDLYVSGEFAPDNTHATAAWLTYSARGLSSPHFFDASGNSGLQPAFSPDGKWIAFGSEETGTPEVYIMDFPAGRARKRISSSGGKEVRWRGDSSELYYLGPDGSILAVKVDGALEKIVSTPAVLFRGNVALGSDGPVYDVSLDGERFLLVEQIPSETGNTIKIIVNWPSLLER